MSISVKPNDYEATVLVKSKKSNTTVKLRLIDNHNAVIIASDGSDFAKISIGEKGEVDLAQVDGGPSIMTPGDAMKCWKECSTECNGALGCVVVCGIECATIIVP